MKNLEFNSKKIADNETSNIGSTVFLLLYDKSLGYISHTTLARARCKTRQIHKTETFQLMKKI